jgi:hypothetical protein
VVEDLTSDVAHEDADNLGVGSAFLEAAFDVGSGVGFEFMRVITMTQRAPLAWRSR